MGERVIEPRKPLWARAEVSWADPLGTLCQAPATLEDTSPSGACIRVKAPIAVGSNLTVRWHLERFSGVARNCRTDGKDFLLGIERNPADAAPPPLPAAEKTESAAELSWNDAGGVTHQASARVESRTPVGTCLTLNTPIPAGAALQISWRGERSSEIVEHCHWKGTAYELSSKTIPATPLPASAASTQNPNLAKQAELASPAVPLPSPEVPTPLHQAQDSPPPLRTKSKSVSERTAMETKNRFPKFWRRQDEAAAPEAPVPAETPASRPTISMTTEAVSCGPADLLAYEDIYRAAGIVSPASGYDVGKVIRMLESEHIRALPAEVKRASVLMALDAAGTTVEELLKDASHHQQALNHYEAGQQEKFEKFEAFKAQEQTKVQDEMERVVAHYAERIQQLRNQVAREKEALHNWQVAKQQESQRIAEVIELLSRTPAAATVSPAADVPATGAPQPPHPVLVSKASAGK